MKNKFYPEFFQSVLKIGKQYEEGSSECKVVTKTLNWMIREYRGSYKRYASNEAQKRAKEMGLKTLDHYSWRTQVISKEKGGMGDKGRVHFHREHIYPISQIIRELMIIDYKKLEEIDNILSKISIAWITKEQQRELDKDKGKSERGNDPLEFCKKRLNDNFTELKAEAKDSYFEEDEQDD